MEPLKMGREKFPVIKMVFQYMNDTKATRNVRVAIRNKARKLCKPIYMTPVDVGQSVGRNKEGEAVPINTMGRHVFGMTGYRANMYTVPLSNDLLVYVYTSNELALKMIAEATEGIGMSLRYTCVLDSEYNRIIGPHGSMYRTIAGMCDQLADALNTCDGVYDGEARLRVDTLYDVPMTEEHSYSVFLGDATISYKDLIHLARMRMAPEEADRPAHWSMTATRENMMFVVFRAVICGAVVTHRDSVTVPDLALTSVLGVEQIDALSGEMARSMFGDFMSTGTTGSGRLSQAVSKHAKDTATMRTVNEAITEVAVNSKLRVALTTAIIEEVEHRARFKALTAAGDDPTIAYDIRRQARLIAGSRFQTAMDSLKMKFLSNQANPDFGVIAIDQARKP